MTTFETIKLERASARDMKLAEFRQIVEADAAGLADENALRRAFELMESLGLDESDFTRHVSTIRRARELERQEQAAAAAESEAERVWLEINEELIRTSENLTRKQIEELVFKRNQAQLRWTNGGVNRGRFHSELVSLKRANPLLFPPVTTA